MISGFCIRLVSKQNFTLVQKVPLSSSVEFTTTTGTSLISTSRTIISSTSFSLTRNGWLLPNCMPDKLKSRHSEVGFSFKKPVMPGLATFIDNPAWEYRVCFRFSVCIFLTVRLAVIRTHFYGGVQQIFLRNQCWWAWSRQYAGFVPVLFKEQ